MTVCPHCLSNDTRVYETKTIGMSTWRRRRCLYCAKTFVSQEIPSDQAFPYIQRGNPTTTGRKQRAPANDGIYDNERTAQREQWANGVKVRIIRQKGDCAEWGQFPVLK